MLNKIVVGSLLATSLTTFLGAYTTIHRFYDEELQDEISSCRNSNGGIIEKSFSDERLGCLHYGRNLKLAQLIHPFYDISMTMQCMKSGNPLLEDDSNCSVRIRVSKT